MEHKPEHKAAITRVKQQLADMLRRGHGIQLHIHPQWDGALLVDGRWKFSSGTWRTGDVSRERLIDMIGAASAWISGAVESVSPNYRPSIFRAGGWCIQPSNEVIPVLKAMGLQADSSVAPGMVNQDPVSWYDFHRSPREAWWPVDADVDRVGSGKFLEVPIASGRVNPYKHLRSRIARRKEGELASGCRGTYQGRSGGLNRLTGIIQKAHKARWTMLDYCTLPADLMIDVIHDWTGRFDATSSAIPVVAIGHTKNFSSGAEKELEALMRWVSGQNNFTTSSYKSWHETVSARAGNT